jgi:hypothetical protein
MATYAQSQGLQALKEIYTNDVMDKIFKAIEDDINREKYKMSEKKWIKFKKNALYKLAKE